VLVKKIDGNEPPRNKNEPKVRRGIRNVGLFLDWLIFRKHRTEFVIVSRIAASFDILNAPHIVKLMGVFEE
jgi:hypothetical protein